MGRIFCAFIIDFLSNTLDNDRDRAIINDENSLFQGEVQVLTGGKVRDPAKVG